MKVMITKRYSIFTDSCCLESYTEYFPYSSGEYTVGIFHASLIGLKAKNAYLRKYVISGQAELPFAIGLHSGLFYSYLTFVLLV